MRTRFRFLRSLWGVALLLAMAASVQAQTTTTSTTLSVAITDQSQTLSLASGTGVAAGSTLYIDREAFIVVSAATTTAPSVRRGQLGSVAVAHSASSVVYVATAAATPSVFRQYDKVGACTATSEPYLPQINYRTGSVQNCTGGFWTSTGADVGTLLVNCRALLIADMVDQSCFVADRPYAVVKIQEVHTVKEAGGTLTLIPRKQTGTTAIASGAALATALDMAAAATIETVRTATLTATAASLLLNAGDRLALDFTDDVAGELAGVTVTFTLVPR